MSMLDKVLNKVKKIGRRKIIIAFTCVVLLVVVFLFLLGPSPSAPVAPKGNEAVSPPVVKATPELKLLEVTPEEGKREDIDAFSKTLFKFSAPILAETARVTVTPSIRVNTVVYKYMPDVLIVEADTVPWSSGVTYTITVGAGLRGSGSEELKSDVVYTFSNIPPEYIDYNPI